MTTYGEVRKWRSAPLDSAVGVLNEHSQQLIGMSDELDSSGAPEGWIGPAAEAAKQDRNRLADGMEGIVAGVAAVRRAVADTADGVQRIEHLVRDAEALAAAKGFVISDQGTVTEKACDAREDREETAKNKVAVETEVRRIMGIAGDVDSFLSGVLGKVAAGQISIHLQTSTLESASRQGAKQGSFHEQLLQKYNVSTDPEGTVMYPAGAKGALLSKFFEKTKLTEGEAEMLDGLGLSAYDALQIKSKAEELGKTVYGGAGVGDGHADAYRHGYLSAELTRKFGPDWSEKFLTAHERVPGNNPTTEAMDLHNNEVGRRVAMAHPTASPEQLQHHLDQAVRNGDMVVLDKEGKLVRSDQVEFGQTGLHQDEQPRFGQEPKKPLDHGGYGAR
ncbi:hypothetical protein L3Q67_29860 [Saccharothrix sp. AJ9571]|nr:hypothetical protein L3Q67_29860 [Saccharothrix sp. AJ9571]